jgi:hypothetical protein
MLDVPMSQLATTQVGCDFNYKQNTMQPKLGLKFLEADSRFIFFLMHPQEVEDIEEIGEIEPKPDVTGLRAYASLGAYARQQASYAD